MNAQMNVQTYINQLRNDQQMLVTRVKALEDSNYELRVKLICLFWILGMALMYIGIWK